jgi:hypothetical protein
LFPSGNKDDNRRITITGQYGDVKILSEKEISVEELRDFPGSVLKGLQESRFGRGIELKPMFFPMGGKDLGDGPVYCSSSMSDGLQPIR